ncbi:hypothetical protein A2U01_0117440, partial [Trifolium medium]|nr:hypothetical protein [Trifolium medium]
VRSAAPSAGSAAPRAAYSKQKEEETK